jgi:uncharacterized protein
MTNPDVSLIEFPCEFSIKIFGKNNDTFQKCAIDIVKKHADDVAEDRISQRISKDSNYISLTITIRAKSKAQINAIYQDFTDAPEITMAL